jgi:integrase
MFRRRETVTIADAAETYLADLAVAGRSKGTLKLYRYLLKALVRAVGPGRSLSAIRRDDIIGCLAQVKARGTRVNHVDERAVGQGYVNLVARTIQSFLKWSMRQGYIVRNPMEGMTLPKEHPQQRRPFSSDEVRRLIAAATTPIGRVAVLLLLDCGLRATELADLRLADVDFESDTLTVHGKGEKVRFVALNQSPRKALLAYLASRPQENGMIWPERFDRNALAFLVGTVGRQAGVGSVYPHRFRHTFATNFLAATGNPLALQALLGHTTLDMVRRYIAASQQDIALDVQRLHCLIPV